MLMCEHMTQQGQSSTLALVATFGERLREARLASGLTQAEAAERSGLTIPNWSAYETGKRTNPGLVTLGAMARALGLDLGELLAGVDEFPGD